MQPTSAQNMDHLVQVFQQVDKDRSGRISAMELQQTLKNGANCPFNPETCRLMVGMFDSEKVGSINFQDFTKLWDFVISWQGHFRSFDKDRSGFIDAREMHMALQALGYRLSESFANVLVRKFDRSERGHVAFDDFVQCATVLATLTQSFRAYDTQMRGVVTLGYEQFLTLVFQFQPKQ